MRSGQIALLICPPVDESASIGQAQIDFLTQRSLDDVTQCLPVFRDERDLQRCCSLKNLMISVNLEAAELC